MDEEIIFANKPDRMVDLAELHKPYKNGQLKCRISENNTERITRSLYATTAFKPMTGLSGQSKIRTFANGAV